MFLRESKQKRVDGTIISYYQLAESVWNKEKKRPTTRIVYNFGRTTEPDMSDKLQKLARSILRRTNPEEILHDDPSWKLIDAWSYGDVYVLEHLWKKLGLDQIIEEVSKGKRLSFSAERAPPARPARNCTAGSNG